jgi:cold shock CspA family protein
VRPSVPSANEIFGYVVSIRETFGFLQPYLSEEQVFFALRDGYRDVAIGDEISFVTKMTPKGMQAEYVRKVQADFKSSTAGVTGIVFREADPYRGTPGLVKLEIPTTSKSGVSSGDAATTNNNSVLVPFLPEDSPSLGGAGGGQGQQRLAPRGDARPRPGILKGDEVEFTLVRIDGTAYARAMLPKVVRTKRDRQLAEQVIRKNARSN